jgi:hypothetical protein
MFGPPVAPTCRKNLVLTKVPQGGCGVSARMVSADLGAEAKVSTLKAAQHSERQVRC